jgi:hypothetical protein
MITMLRSLHLTGVLAIASILLIAETASSQPPTVSSNYPLVSRSDTDKLICYMQTADGITLNLSSLCGQKSKVKSEVVISHVGYEDNFFIGRVVNKSSKTVYQARINYETIGKNGSVIARGAISTEPPTLSPGQAAMFRTLMPDAGNNVRTTSVEWDE